MWVRGAKPTHWVTSVTAYDASKYCAEVFHSPEIDGYVAELHRHVGDGIELIAKCEFPSVDQAQQQIAHALINALFFRERGAQPEPERALS